MKHASFFLAILVSSLSHAEGYYYEYHTLPSSYPGEAYPYGSTGSYKNSPYSMNYGNLPKKDCPSVTSINSDASEQVNSAFRIAVREDRTQDAKQMLFEKKVDINSHSEEGTTALMHAARNCSIDMVKLLLKSGSDVNTQDSKGRTALMHAITENCKPVSLILCQSHDLNLKLKDERGNTAQDYATAESAFDVAGSASEINDFLHKTSQPRKTHLKKGG